MKQEMFNKLRSFRFKQFSGKAYSAFCSLRKEVTIGVVANCVLTFAAAGTVSAQTNVIAGVSSAETEHELDEVTVTASRVELAMNQAARLVTVITKEEIQQSPVRSIQDLLNYAANIDVVQRGGHGVQADISIRGGSFDQTAILLNGVNLSNPQTGHYSFDIPVNLSDVERIEIIHGPSSITYGASAFSGGINIITKKTPDHKAYANIEAGSHGLWGVQASGALTSELASSQLSAGYNTSDGYTANSDYDIWNLLWQTRLKPEEKSTVDIQLGYNDKRYGANTFYSAAYPNQYDKTSSYFASVRGETGDRLKFIPVIYWNRHYDEFQLYRDGTPDLPSWYVGHNYHRSDVYGANLNIQYTSSLGITSLGSELRNEGVLSNVLGKTMTETDGHYTKSDDRTNVSFALEHNVLLSRFTLTAGLLANYNTSLRGSYKFYPSINVSYRILDNLKTFASWNKATRMPTFTDLYYTTATHIGNTDLKPENSEAFELGVKYNTWFMSLYATAYLMKGKNIIDWVKPNVDAKWESRNITKLDKKGIELGARFALHEVIPVLPEQTVLHAGYARLNQDKSSGNLISNYALNYLRDKVTLKLEHPIVKNVTVNWNFRWQKRMGGYTRYDKGIKGEFANYEPFSTLDLRINWQLKEFMLHLSANNLYDTKFYDLGNVPQAGFWLIGGISYTIR
ncbi:TonB-dependent receptor [Massilibacteroides sp.]|uniref:TonB-dependent receptor plug domain-containing protein n=1 Tax=Massilibacteroides sp. TaxID=2034766 RepID=UPI0026360F9B|nr:TonB-dependent receptor [Massilibacteroides sp.]MDD4514108.1 TonB-dependent receptor [Massilibacteroides sp.]